MTELERVQPAERLPVLNPLSGELVDPSDLPRVAQALADVREAKRRLDEARAYAEDVLADESKRVGSKTLHLDGWKAEVSGGTRLVWDLEKLRAGLRDADCPEDRIEALITETVEYKVNNSVARQLAGANDAYKAAIDAARSYVPAAVRVSVEATRGR